MNAIQQLCLVVIPYFGQVYLLDYQIWSVGNFNIVINFSIAVGVTGSGCAIADA